MGPFSLEKNKTIVDNHEKVSLCTSDLLLDAMLLIVVQRHLDAEKCVTLPLFPFLPALRSFLTFTAQFHSVSGPPFYL